MIYQHLLILTGITQHTLICTQRLILNSHLWVSVGIVPPVPRQHGCTAAFVGGWVDGGRWWSELRWCGSADSQWHSSGWCWDHRVWPPPQGSSELRVVSKTHQVVIFCCIQKKETLIMTYIVQSCLQKLWIWDVCFVFPHAQALTQLTYDGDGGADHAVPLLESISAHSN